MKCWPLIIALTLLLLPTSASAEAPKLGPKPVPEPLVLAQPLPFPSVKITTVDRCPEPHVHTRLTVAGEDWEFSLVERRWGWELETALTEQRTVRALAFASLDYLAGNPDAMRIFTRPDPAYLQLLDGLTGRR